MRMCLPISGWYQRGTTIVQEELNSDLNTLNGIQVQTLRLDINSSNQILTNSVQKPSSEVLKS